MKIAYIGIDLFYTALETLHDLGCEIQEIFTCKTDNVTEFNLKITKFAEMHNIPCTTERITAEDIERLIKNGCEAAICGGYYFKIPSSTDLPIVNIHPSLLPIGRGSWPMAQAILWKHEKSGVTIHKIAEGFDTGDILLQREFELSKDETHLTFMEKANALLPEMLAELVANFEELYKKAVPQGKGEYWAAPIESDYTITPDMTAAEADLILRAFYGYECIYNDGGKKTVITGGRAVASANKEKKAFVLSDGYIKLKSDNFI
jgi:methionyl-tRNA formyltransferase